MSEKMELTFTKFDEATGDEIEVSIPGKFEVCDRCSGKGTHVNPSIDGHGITADEWNGPDWDEESRETYLTGGYDVPCHECGGKRVILVPDETKADAADLKEFFENAQAEADDRAADAHTCRMENGGFD